MRAMHKRGHFVRFLKIHKAVLENFISSEGERTCFSSYDDDPGWAPCHSDIYRQAKDHLSSDADDKSV